MNEDRQVALPKLYGAPAYARPPVIPTAPAERPFDPDDLPLESERTGDDEVLAAQLAAQPYGNVAMSAEPVGAAGGGSILRARAFRLRIPSRSRDR